MNEDEAVVKALEQLRSHDGDEDELEEILREVFRAGVSWCYNHG